MVSLIWSSLTIPKHIFYLFDSILQRQWSHIYSFQLTNYNLCQSIILKIVSTVSYQKGFVLCLLPVAFNKLKLDLVLTIKLSIKIRLIAKNNKICMLHQLDSYNVSTMVYFLLLLLTFTIRVCFL